MSIVLDGNWGQPSKLKQIFVSTGAYCEFAYNASGLRTKKQYNDPESGNADTVYYLYDGINPIAEYGPDGTILTRYVYAGGMHVAKIAGADTTWYHGDALGSARKMTKEDGTGYDWAATYYPFGEMTPTGNGANTHGFTGKEFDTEMGLNYFCLRYYDPQIGRFMTLDPFSGYVELPQSQNSYAYVMNNPLKYIDPLGLNGDDDYPFYGWIAGVEARARRYYELWYATSRGHGGGQDVPGRPPPKLPLTFEDLVYRHMIPGWTVDENGNVVRILPKQNLRDRPDMMPKAPSYGSTPAQADVLSFGQPQIDMPEPIYERVHKNYLHQIAEEEGLINVGEIITEYCISRLISKGISLLIFETTIVPRTALGADGAFSQTIKTKLFGKTMTVEHQVFRNGEMIHNNFPYVWP